MRKLSTVTARVIPIRPPSGPTVSRTYDRRRRGQAVFDSLTALCLIRHDENPTQLLASNNGDPAEAIWLNKAPLLVDPKDRGRFLVVQLTRQMAQEKGLYLTIVERERFAAEEQPQLEDAIQAARRIRERMSGRSTNRPTWHGGRNAYA